MTPSCALVASLCHNAATLVKHEQQMQEVQRVAGAQTAHTAPADGSHSAQAMASSITEPQHNQQSLHHTHHAALHVVCI